MKLNIFIILPTLTRIEVGTHTHTHKNEEGIVAPRDEQPRTVKEIEGVEGSGHAAPPHHPFHVQRRNHDPCDMVEEEE